MDCRLHPCTELQYNDLLAQLVKSWETVQIVTEEPAISKALINSKLDAWMSFQCHPAPTGRKVLAEEAIFSG